MLDRKLIRENPEEVLKGARRKGIEPPLQEFQETDQAWRDVLVDLEVKQAESNKISKSIGQLMGQGKKDEAEAAKKETANLKAAIRELEPKAKELEEKRNQIELRFPNMPHTTAPDGKDENDNVMVRDWGEQPTGDHFIPHWEIAEEKGLIDFDRGVKVSGSGFVVYTSGFWCTLGILIRSWRPNDHKPQTFKIILPLCS